MVNICLYQLISKFIYITLQHFFFFLSINLYDYVDAFGDNPCINMGLQEYIKNC